MQNNGHYTVESYSRSPILVSIESPYVINTNLYPTSHRFQVIADYWLNLRF